MVRINVCVKYTDLRWRVLPVCRLFGAHCEVRVGVVRERKRSIVFFYRCWGEEEEVGQFVVVVNSAMWEQ